MNTIENLESSINRLWSSRIKKIEFNLLNNSIIFETTSENSGVKTEYNLTFFDVSSYYYTRNNGESRFSNFSYEEGDYLELTSIDYFKDGVGSITIDSLEKSWVKEYNASANFALEIWSSLLFIEAKSIKINNEEYKDLIKY